MLLKDCVKLNDTNSLLFRHCYARCRYGSSFGIDQRRFVRRQQCGHLAHATFGTATKDGCWATRSDTLYAHADAGGAIHSCQ